VAYLHWQRQGTQYDMMSYINLRSKLTGNQLSLSHKAKNYEKQRN